MRLMISRRFLFLLIGCLAAPLLYGQFNIKIAYDLAFASPDNMNRVLTDFNEERDWLDKRFEEFRFHQGIQLGARYSLDIVDLEFSLFNLFENNKAEGLNPALNLTQHRQLFFQFRGFSVGASRRIGFFQLGGSLDLESFRLRWRESDDGDKTTLVNDRQLTSHFFIGFETPKYNGLSISIRPYVKIPWGTYNFQSLSDELENASPPGGTEDEFRHFGIQFLFFNGQ